jgi:hypothetical protein
MAAARRPCLQPAHAVVHPRLFALGCGITVARRDGDVCMPLLGPNTPATRERQATHVRLAEYWPGVLRQRLTARRPC